MKKRKQRFMAQIGFGVIVTSHHTDVVAHKHNVYSTEFIANNFQYNRIYELANEHIRLISCDQSTLIINEDVFIYFYKNLA